jgi:hypothetical protein
LYLHSSSKAVVAAAEEAESVHMRPLEKKRGGNLEQLLPLIQEIEIAVGHPHIQ